MKNATRLRWPLLITGCAQQTFYCSKQTRQQWHQRKPSPIISSSFPIGQKENCRCSQNLAAENVKTETQQTFVNGLLGFITFRHLYSAGSACVLLRNNCMSCPSIWKALSALLINMLLGSFQLFCIVISLSEGEMTIPFWPIVCQSGEAALSTPEAAVASRTD